MTDNTIDDRTRVPLRNVAAIAAAAVALGGWLMAVKSDLGSFERALESSTVVLTERLDAVVEAVEALDDSRVRLGDMSYWITEARRRNPTLDLPEFPTH